MLDIVLDLSLKMMNSIFMILTVLIQINADQYEIRRLEGNDEIDENGHNKIFPLWIQEEEEDDTNIEIENTKIPLTGAVKLKKSNLDNSYEDIKEMHIQVDFTQVDFRNHNSINLNSKNDNIFYWESIHFTILSKLGVAFDCEFIVTYGYTPPGGYTPPIHESTGRFKYKFIIDGFEIKNILYDLKISDNKGGLSAQKVGIDSPQKILYVDSIYSKEYVLKEFGPFSSGEYPAIPNRIMGFIKVEFIANYKFKKQKSNEFEDDYEYDEYEYDGLTMAERYDFWTRGSEKIQKIEEMQGIFIEEYEENQVRIKEMFNQMSKFAEKHPKRDYLDDLELPEPLELLEFDEHAIEKKILQFRERKYGSEKYHYLNGEPWSQLNSSEKILLEKAVHEMDVELLTSLVIDRRHKNPVVDSKTKDTVLHYLAQQESDNVDLFFTIARNIHGLFIKNANGMTPIDLAAEKGHFNIVRYICLESMHYMRKKPPLMSRPSTIDGPPVFLSGSSNFKVEDLFEIIENPFYNKFIGSNFLTKPVSISARNEHDQVFMYIFAHLLDLNENNEEQLKEVHRFGGFSSINDKTTAKKLYENNIYDIEINQGILDEWEKFLLERSLYEKDEQLLRNLVVLRKHVDYSEKYESRESLLELKNTHKNPLVNSETQDTILHYILTWKYEQLKEDDVFFKMDTNPTYYLDEMERMKLFVILHSWSEPFVDDLFAPNHVNDSPFDLAVANNFSIIVDYILNSTHPQTELFNVTFLLEEENGLNPEFIGSKFLKKGLQVAGIKGHLEIFFNIYTYAVWHGNFPTNIIQKTMSQVHDFLMKIKSEFHKDIIQLMKAMLIFDEVAARKSPEEMKKELLAEFNPGELERLKKTFKKPESLDAFMRNNTKASNMRSRNHNVKTEL